MADILVTGGAGFIGSNIARLALERGYRVRILDNLSTGSMNNLEGLDGLEVEYINGDVQDPEVALEATRGVKYVFHQAALSASTQFVPDPSTGLKVNVLGFSNILLASSKNQVSKVVYAMTSSMYGNAPVPWAEDDLLVSCVPNVYALSLLARAFISNQFEKTSKIRTVGLVYFSVYGRYEAAKGNLANIVSQFLWKIKNNQSPILYGDGEQTRDFVNVSDVARANLMAAEADYSGGFLNVGTGKQVTMKDIATRLADLMQKDVEPVYEPNPIYGYCYHTCADTRKAAETIGFRARISLDDGLRDLVEFYKESDSR